MTGRTDRTLLRVAGLSLVVATLFPAAAMPIFNGLPLRDSLEVGGTILGAALLLFSARLVGFARLWRVSLPIAITVGSLIALGGKVMLLAAPVGGFTACYTIPLDGMPGTCSRSFDAPLARDWTQRESTIDFRSALDPAAPLANIRDSTWNIGAINSNELNFYGPERPDRMRLPIRASWLGVASESGSMTVTYLGEGHVAVGDSKYELPPMTETAGQVVIPFVAGEEIRLDYAWSLTDNPQGPYGTIVVTNTDTGELLGTRGPPGGAIALSWSLAVLILLCMLGALLVLARWLWRQPVALLGLATLLAVAVVIRNDRLPSWSDYGLAMVVMATLFCTRWFADRARTLLVAWVGLPWLAIEFMTILYPQVEPYVVYRDGGSDFLTYEGFARSILEGDGLRGGEPTFVYSPAIRYLIYTQRLVFGEASAYIVAAALFILLFTLWFAIEYSLVTRVTTRPLRRNGVRPIRLTAGHPWLALASLVSAVLLITLLWSYEVTRGSVWLLSEYPTWALMTIALPIAVFGRRPAVLALGSAALGLALTFRGNQLAGLLSILAVALVRVFVLNRHGYALGRLTLRLGAIAIPFTALALLPGVHNLVYGGSFVPIATSTAGTISFPLPPGRLLDWGTDPQVADILTSQLSGVLVLPNVRPDEVLTSGAFAFSVHAIQVGLVLLLGVGIVRRFRGAFWGSALVLVPLAFLIPHIFVQVYVYYPRHIVQGYLAGALVLVASVGLHISHRAALAAVDSAHSGRVPVHDRYLRQ